MKTARRIQGQPTPQRRIPFNRFQHSPGRVLIKRNAKRLCRPVHPGQVTVPAPKPLARVKPEGFDQAEIRIGSDVRLATSICA